MCYVRENLMRGVLVSIGDHERLQGPLCVAKISNYGVLLLGCNQGQNDWEECRPLQTEHVSIIDERSSREF